MPTLFVNNGYEIAMPGLGKIKPLPTLGEKRVTVAVRDALSSHYGPDKIKVACEAEFCLGRRIGTCWIGGKQ